MKIFIISLRSALEKRAHIKTQLDQCGINYEFFDAIDGSALKSFSTFREWRDPWSHLHITKGEVGCALSHFMVWEKIKKDTAPAAMVLEDDFIIQNPDIFKLLAQWHGNPLFDFLYLGRKKISAEPEAEVPIASIGFSSLER